MPPHNRWYLITSVELAMIREQLDRLGEENPGGENAGECIRAIKRSLESIEHRLN